jgi:hypothetical protein
MSDRLFAFVQIEFPWVLGPTDGRYVVRDRTGELEQIVVLETLGAPQRRFAAARRSQPRARPEPTPVATARVTVIDPTPLAAERQVRAWLSSIDDEAEVDRALAVLNRVLHAHRIAAADPYLHEVSAKQALVLRAGWGEGVQVAEGRWRDARTLTLREPRRRRRTAVLRPQERLALLVGGRTTALMSEELALRARLDLDHVRPRHAALELRAAYASALEELGDEQRPDLAERLAELTELQSGVEAAARAALPGSGQEPDAEVLRHALARLEAIFRARTAAGFNPPA